MFQQSFETAVSRTDWLWYSELQPSVSVNEKARSPSKVMCQKQDTNHIDTTVNDNW